ncbi:MAG: GntR family transcriptional regulator [Pleurocapsa sp. SU_196_0]|nr:GntR family transcriptional regulator [Pleurocapsa sp. SU_196_0]
MRDEVYDHLKLEILSGQLPSGSRLAEIALAERLGVSRTPVREAVQRLAQDGLVEVAPNRGAKVRGVSAQEVEDVYAVREVLDGLAARLAASHRTKNDLRTMREALERLERANPQDFGAQVAADLEFHNAIAIASKNAALETTLRGLSQGVARVKLLTRAYNQSLTTRDAHTQILEAIERGDATDAEERARGHVRHFSTIILQELAPVLGGHRA